jgi:hypothetical protein
MAYSVFVSRKTKDNPEDLITLEEWRQVIRHSQELTPCSSAKAKTNHGTILTVKATNMAIWEDDKVSIYLTLINGEIKVDGPNELVMSRMLLIATLLSAFVVGEEGEAYEASNSSEEALLFFKDKFNAKIRASRNRHQLILVGSSMLVIIGVFIASKLINYS